jgi:hypothetical protein
MASASIALSVGAAKLTKMRGKFGLAKIGSSTLGNPAAQTIEYKGFGGEKARILPHLVIQERGGKRQFAGSNICKPLWLKD